MSPSPPDTLRLNHIGLSKPTYCRRVAKFFEYRSDPFKVDLCRGIPRLVCGRSESPTSCYDGALESYAPLTVAMLHPAPDLGKRSEEGSGNLPHLRLGSVVPVRRPGSGIRTLALIYAVRTKSPSWSVTREDVGQDPWLREANGAASHQRKLVDLGVQLISLRSRTQSKRRHGLRPRVR